MKLFWHGCEIGRYGFVWKFSLIRGLSFGVVHLARKTFCALVLNCLTPKTQPCEIPDIWLDA